MGQTTKLSEGIFASVPGELAQPEKGMGPAYDSIGNQLPCFLVLALRTSWNGESCWCRNVWNFQVIERKLTWQGVNLEPQSSWGQAIYSGPVLDSRGGQPGHLMPKIQGSLFPPGLDFQALETDIVFKFPSHSIFSFGTCSIANSWWAGSPIVLWGSHLETSWDRQQPNGMHRPLWGKPRPRDVPRTPQQWPSGLFIWMSVGLLQGPMDFQGAAQSSWGFSPETQEILRDRSNWRKIIIASDSNRDTNGNHFSNAVGQCLQPPSEVDQPGSRLKKSSTAVRLKSWHLYGCGRKWDAWVLKCLGELGKNEGSCSFSLITVWVSSFHFQFWQEILNRLLMCWAHNEIA